MIPGTHILRFFLAPDDFKSRVGQVGRCQTQERLLVEGIDLLQPDERTAVAPSILFTVGLEVIIDLAAAQNEALDFCRIGGLRPLQNFVEAAFGEFLRGRCGKIGTEETLGCHDDERLAEVA